MAARPVRIRPASTAARRVSRRRSRATAALHFGACCTCPQLQVLPAGPPIGRVRVLLLATTFPAGRPVSWEPRTRIHPLLAVSRDIAWPSGVSANAAEGHEDHMTNWFVT